MATYIFSSNGVPQWSASYIGKRVRITSDLDDGPMVYSASSPGILEGIMNYNGSICALVIFDQDQEHENMVNVPFSILEPVGM